MTMSKKVISVILAVVMLATTFTLSGFSAFAAEIDEQVSSANAKSAAAMEIDKNYRYDGNDLGATYSPESTTFKVWAPTATEVAVNLYTTGSDKENGAEKLGSYSLALTSDPTAGEASNTGVWTVTIEGDYKNIYYTYSITTTNTTGTQKVTTYETQDVYSKAVGVNGKRSMIVDLDDTDPEGWENDAHVLLDNNTDASIWEIQIKDFSYNENSGVSEANRGKYLAFAETGTTLNGEGEVSTCVDYLKELGITTVHINPFYDFASIDETGSGSQFNWGYDPENYNVPEGSYSSNPYDGNVRIKECKEMVQALHNAGIQVVMDVVYNHTYSNDSCFQKTVPDYYYRFTSTGAWSNGSGTGNETASERAMFRNFVVQSCAYWVNEYHIDGFRFDLMGCMDVETMNAIRAELDTIDPRILTYGEGWAGGTATFDPTTCEGTKTYGATLANVAKLNERIALFNDKIRDGIKGSVFESSGQGFVQGNRASAKNIYYGIRANTVGKLGWQPTAPSQCVTYSSCHDNATLYDRLINSTDTSGNPDYTKRYPELIEMNKLAGAIVMTSQGMNFVLAGEEMARTKLGDENSYKSAATLNMLNWENLNTYGDLVSYYKGLYKIRKAFSPFTDATLGSKDNYTLSGSLSTANSYTVSYTVSNSTPGEWSKVAVIYNGARTESTVTLKDTSVTEWVIIANDKEAGLQKLGEVSGSTFVLPASSAIIAVDKASFEAESLSDNLGKVIIKDIDQRSGEVISERVIKGTIGTKYVTVPDSSIDIKYEIKGVTGSETGVFTEEPQEVVYEYADYIPEHAKKADFNGDGKVDILDVTCLQLYLAKLYKIDDSLTEYADVNYDGYTTIFDATTLQYVIANLSIATSTVEVNHYDGETGEKIADTENYIGRVGYDYSTSPKNVLAYTFDETKIPDNASGKYVFGVNTVVNYYYLYSGKKETLHIKYSDDSAASERAMSLWAWQEQIPMSDGTLGSVNLSKKGSWPGDAVSTAKDENGWWTASVDTPGVGVFCFILSVSGSPQTQDYKGFTDEELWVVVDGNNMVNQGDWLSIYNVDPETNPDASPLA